LRSGQISKAGIGSELLSIQSVLHIEHICVQCKNVRHERILYRVRATAQEMRVWPLEAGLQEQVSNHLKLLWSNAMVVSVKEKSRLKIVAGVDHGDKCKRTTDEVSKITG